MVGNIIWNKHAIVWISKICFETIDFDVKQFDTRTGLKSYLNTLNTSHISELTTGVYTMIMLLFKNK